MDSDPESEDSEASAQLNPELDEAPLEQPSPTPGQTFARGELELNQLLPGLGIATNNATGQQKVIVVNAEEYRAALAEEPQAESTAAMPTTADATTAYDEADTEAADTEDAAAQDSADGGSCGDPRRRQRRQRHNDC